MQRFLVAKCGMLHKYNLFMAHQQKGIFTGGSYPIASAVGDSDKKD